MEAVENLSHSGSLRSSEADAEAEADAQVDGVDVGPCEKKRFTDNLSKLHFIELEDSSESYFCLRPSAKDQGII